MSVNVPSSDEFAALADRVTKLEQARADGRPFPATPKPSPGIWAGWGEPADRAKFDGNTVDQSFWGLYDSVGNGGNGRRSPGAFSQSNGVLTIAGTEDNVTGGTQSNPGHAHSRGRWVVEMRVNTFSPGKGYHAVAAVIPQGVAYLGGARDLDFAEFDAGQPPYCFLHYRTPDGNKQDYALAQQVDTTQWHEYVLEVADGWMVWYIDGKVQFVDTNLAAIPDKRIGLGFNIQLDAFQPGGMAHTNMDVRRFDYYELPSNVIQPTGPMPSVGDYR